MSEAKCERCGVVVPEESSTVIFIEDGVLEFPSQRLAEVAPDRDGLRALLGEDTVYYYIDVPKEPDLEGMRADWCGEECFMRWVIDEVRLQRRLRASLRFAA